MGRIELPGVALTIESAAGASLASQHLPRITLRLDDLEVRAEDGGTARVRVGDFHLRAERYNGGWDSLTSIAVARVEASAADSLIRLDSVEVRPTLTLGEQRRRSRWRDTRVSASIAALEARGVDYGALLRSHAVQIRMLEMAQPKLDLLLDKHREPDPRPKPARMPNDIMRRLPLRVTIDTIRGSGGVISYGELLPGRQRPGVVTFEQVRGSIANLSNDPRRMTDQRPMILTATTHLMGSGRFFTVLEIPLLAERFSMRYRGTLGPMPLTEFNRFAAANTPTKIRQGDGLGLAFDARVVDGHATGRLIPRYRDLKIGINRRGGGFLAAVGRRISSFFANHFKLRTDNPEDDGRGRLVVGQIDRRREPSENLFPFLWFTLRDALKPVMSR